MTYGLLTFKLWRHLLVRFSLQNYLVWTLYTTTLEGILNPSAECAHTTWSDCFHTCEKPAIDYTLLVPALKCLFDNGCQRSLIDGNIALLNKITCPGSYHILWCEFVSQNIVWTPCTVLHCHREHVGKFSFWIFTSIFDLSSPWLCFSVSCSCPCRALF